MLAGLRLNVHEAGVFSGLLGVLVYRRISTTVHECLSQGG